MMRTIRVILILVPALLVSPAGAVTTCCHWVCANGGVPMGSGNFVLTGTVGQAAIGYSGAPSHALWSGFWDPLYYLVAGVDLPAQLIPRECQLAQNRPNPFRSATAIQFALPQRMHVAIRLYDVAGRLVRTMVNHELDPGYHVVHLDRTGLASGVYAYRMEAGRYAATRRLVLVR